MDVFPDFDGLGGIGDLRAVIGALLTFVLIVAVLMLIVSAIVWAIAAANGNHAIASKGRTGVLVALGAAVLAGGGVAWMNWLIAPGDQLWHPARPPRHPPSRHGCRLALPGWGGIRLLRLSVVGLGQVEVGRT